MPVARLVTLAIVAVAVIAASSLLGPVWAGGEITDPDSPFWRLRAPRVVQAALSGASLALAGVVLQALFQNPLASPFTLGVASGASLGAAAALLLGAAGTVLGQPAVTFCALLGGLAALGTVYLLAIRQPQRDMSVLLLGGVCVSYLCGATIMLIVFVANKHVTNDIVIWMIGSLAGARWRASLEIALLLGPTLAIMLANHRGLDLLMFGDQLAATRGVSVDRLVWGCLLLVGVLTAVVAASCGPIAFVGLVVPHICRNLVGPRTMPLVVSAALTGAAFLAVCDGIVRLLPIEPPVGVVTNMLGAGFFFYLLATRGTAGSRVR